MPAQATIVRILLLVAALPALAACVSLTAEPRALLSGPTGIEVRTLSCEAAMRTATAARASGKPAPLDPASIRVVTWNIHKEGDTGWEADLARFVAGSDILLLQEVTLGDSLREILAAGGLRWVMASSFIYESADIGVLTATRTAPVASCTQRVVEPLTRLPKSAVISWLPLAGSPHTLAVANVHSINFSLSLGSYEAQLAALADTLAAHDGPIILGGDLNTWTSARMDAVRNVAVRLRLTEIPFAEDGRTLFLGNQVDHLLVRGLDVVASGVNAVTSSDHNPAAAVLRVTR